jgi:hypothetical protein
MWHSGDNTDKKDVWQSYMNLHSMRRKCPVKFPSSIIRQNDASSQPKNGFASGISRRKGRLSGMFLPYSLPGHVV